MSKYCNTQPVVPNKPGRLFLPVILFACLAFIPLAVVAQEEVEGALNSELIQDIDFKRSTESID